MEKSSINIRFIETINTLLQRNKKLTKGEIASSLSIKPAKFSEILNERMNVGVELIALLAIKYKVSSNWLLTGEGEMFNTESSSISPNNTTKNHPTSIETRPRIPFDAAAGQLSIALESATEDDCEQIPVIPTFPRYDFTIIARGNSMEPQYLSGDELACLFISDSSFIQWGRSHVLDTAQGVVVKRIFDNGDSILCKSNNPAYPDFSIPKTDIYRMALVVGYIRIE